MDILNSIQKEVNELKSRERMKDEEGEEIIISEFTLTKEQRDEIGKLLEYQYPGKVIRVPEWYQGNITQFIKDLKSIKVINDIVNETTLTTKHKE